MAKVEIIDNTIAKLTFEISPEEFELALQQTYETNKNHINIQGFRKGKAPRRLVEKMYGEDFFYQDAINKIYPYAFSRAVRESDLHVVDDPTEISFDSVSKDNGVVITATCFYLGELEIDGYYALTYEAIDTEPTEDEIQQVIENDRQKNARIITVDRPVQNGDLVTIDYVGSIDGVPFEGGAAEDFDLTIGSNSFIDTFENQLLESKQGDHVTVYVTFPDNYHEDLAGKAAIFEVDIKEVKETELPLVDDDFAQDVSEFESLNDYRADIRARIKRSKEFRAVRIKEDQVLRQLCDKLIGEYPAVLVEKHLAQRVNEFENNLRRQGIEIDQYCLFKNITEDQLYESQKQEAEYYVRSALALRAVARKESFVISKDEIEAEVQRLIKFDSNNNKVFEPNPHSVEESLLSEKAMQFVVDKAVAINLNQR